MISAQYAEKVLVSFCLRSWHVGDFFFNLTSICTYQKYTLAYYVYKDISKKFVEKCS